ncbi:MAG: hypothetical protein WC794_01525 [Candidatus Doudnabacteria bacterium]
MYVILKENNIEDMKNLLLIIPAVLLLAVGCNSPQSTTQQPKPNNQSQNNFNQNPMDQDLKSQLEIAYNKVRAAIDAKGDKATFDLVFEENDDPSLPPISKDEWSYWLDVANKIYPDLKYTKFIKIEENNNYTYYFAEIHRPDYDKGINISAFAFHKVSGIWKLSAKNTASNSDETVFSVEEIEKVKPQIIADLEKQISQQDNN